MLLSYTNELKIPELDNAKTNRPENLQDNGATPPVNTEPSLPQSPPEDTLVVSDNPHPCPRIKARDAAFQACAGDLPDVCPLSTHYMLYGVYHEWVQQNIEERQDGQIT